MNTSNFSRLTLCVLAITVCAQSAQAQVVNGVVVGVKEAVAKAAPYATRFAAVASRFVPGLSIFGPITGALGYGAYTSYNAQQARIAAEAAAAEAASKGFVASAKRFAESAVSSCKNFAVNNGSKGLELVKSHPYYTAAGVVGTAAVAGICYKMLQGSSVKADGGNVAAQQPVQTQQNAQANQQPIQNNWFHGVNQTTKDAFAQQVATFVTTPYTEKAANDLFAASSRFCHSGLTDLVTDLIKLKKQQSQQVESAQKAGFEKKMSQKRVLIKSLLQ